MSRSYVTYATAYLCWSRPSPGRSGVYRSGLHLFDCCAARAEETP
jgi:hypothetical protein